VKGRFNCHIRPPRLHELQAFVEFPSEFFHQVCRQDRYAATLTLKRMHQHTFAFLESCVYETSNGLHHSVPDIQNDLRVVVHPDVAQVLNAD
jgi:hypothetical protein